MYVVFSPGGGKASGRVGLLAMPRALQANLAGQHADP